MAYGVKLLVWGDYASFNRPEMKVERVTYDVITPSASRGILEAIYWKPQIRWVVDAIRVLNPIRFTNVRRNEVKGVIPVKGALSKAMRGENVPLGMSITDSRQQRAATVLCDVRYGIEARLDVVEAHPTEKKPEAKHLDQFRRRAERGAFFHQPYLGTREFPAFFELVDSFPDCAEALRKDIDLGLMLHDIVFEPDPEGTIVESNSGRRLTARPRFFHAHMRDGLIRVPSLPGPKEATS